MSSYLDEISDTCLALGAKGCDTPARVARAFIYKYGLLTNKILGFSLFSEVFVRELERKARRGRFKQHLWSLLCFSRWLGKHFG